MGLTNAFRDYIAQSCIGEAVTAYDNTDGYIGVGNSATAFVATQTDMVGASKARKVMNATYPQRATNVLTFQATFGTGEANFAWEEWGVFNHASAGDMMNRKVASLGTKTSAQSWQIEVDNTVTAA